MADISEKDLKKEIDKLLDDAELDQMSSKKVRQQLEKNLGVDLTERRKLIDKMVMDYVNSQPPERFNKKEEESEEESAEEEEPPPVKKAAKKRPKSYGNSYIWKKKDGHIDSDDYSDKSVEEKKPAKKGRKKKGSDDDSGNEWEKKTKAKKGGGGAKRSGTGFTRSYKLSPALADLMGQDEMPRHQVVKRIWEIIKKNNLYDPNNKHFAVCDDALYKVFGVKRFRAFGMMKYLKTHFIAD